MNSILELNFWSRLLGILALEILCVVALALLVQSLVRSAFWRRTIWQISFVCILFLAVAELTGVGRGISIWLAGKPVPERIVSVHMIPTDDQFISVPMDYEFPEPVFIPEKEMPIARSIWWPGILWFAGLGLIAARILFARVLFIVLRLRNRRIEDFVLLNRVYELAKRLGIIRRIRLLESPGFTSPVAFESSSQASDCRSRLRRSSILPNRTRCSPTNSRISPRAIRSGICSPIVPPPFSGGIRRSGLRDDVCIPPANTPPMKPPRCWKRPRHTRRMSGESRPTDDRRTFFRLDGR